jgi:Cu(I)/Ag(I) efflux system membrane fusion protein
MSQPSDSKPTVSPSHWPERIPHRPILMGIARFTVAVVAIALVAGIGLGIGRATGKHAAEPLQQGSMERGGDASDIRFYTCSMHPQIKLPGFGPCPICFMDLIPVRAGDAESAGDAISLSARAQRLARVETAEVQPRELTHELPLVGKVAPDETRITYISSYIPGRLEKLFVNFTGGQVRKGDHLAEIYSPQLLVAQREYLLAFENARRTASTTTAPGTAPPASGQAMLDAARTRLELWGVPRDQIEELERRRVPSDRMRIDAPQEGWVTERLAYEGMYAETGVRLFSLVDLRQVWVMLAAYEQDLQLLRLTQEVNFEAEAHPGRRFGGKITYVDPTLNEATRTVRVRVNVPNADLALKPGMFVRARVHVRIGERGRAIAPKLAGKWVCYMHPEIVKGAQGTCDICEMNLVTAESLNLGGDPAESPLALTVPQSAVLLTGPRAIVYVEQAPPAAAVALARSSRDPSRLYEPREIELGPRIGDAYVVLAGLTSGERIVVRGAAQLDSAVQIQGKHSMMQPPEGGQSAAPPMTSRAVAGGAYHITTSPMLRAYLALTRALADDGVEASLAALREFKRLAEAAMPDGLDSSGVDDFKSQISSLKSAIPDSITAPDRKPDIEAIRTALPKISASMYRFLRTFGHDRQTPVVRAFCPMAFDDKGAEWLQAGDEIANPYFGAKMLLCGEIRGRIAFDGREGR